MKGAIERVIDNCSFFYEQGQSLVLPEKQKHAYLEEAQMLALRGLRGWFFFSYIKNFVLDISQLNCK